MLDARKSTFSQNVHRLSNKNNDRVRPHFYQVSQVEKKASIKRKKVGFTSGNELKQVRLFDPDSFDIIPNKDMAAQQLLAMKLIPDKLELASLQLLANTTEEFSRYNYILTQMKSARKNNTCQFQADKINIDVSLNKAIQSLEKLKDRENNMLLQAMQKLNTCISQSIEENNSHDEHTNEERASLDNVITGLKKITEHSTSLRVLAIEDYFEGYEQEYKNL